MLLPKKRLFQILIILKCILLTYSYSDPNHFRAPQPGWVDPFDMLGENHHSDSLVVQSDVEIHVLKERCGMYEIYLRRFVNQFLNAIELRDPSVSKHSKNFVKLEFMVSGKDISILQKFGRNENNDEKLESVDNVLTNIFSQKTPQERSLMSFYQVLTWFQKTFLQIISSPEWTVLSSVSLLLLLTLWLIYKTHNYRLAMVTVLVTIFFGGFGFTWIRMYEEKEVERYMNVVINSNVPYHCSGKPMVWYEHIFYRMFGVDCLQFYKTRDIRPIVKISPTEVLAETVSYMLVIPASNIGHAYSNFVSSSIRHLPNWLKPIALPLCFLLPVFIFTVVMAFLFNYRISLSWTGLHILPSWYRTPQIEVKQDGRYVQEVLQKENESVQQKDAINCLLSDNNAPVFLMNWRGLKKISSSNLLADKIKEDKTNLTESDQGGGNHSEDESSENAKMMEELKEFEEFVTSMENKKYTENGKRKRSVHTCSEGGTSLSNRLSEDKNLLMIESNALSSGDHNSKEKEHQGSSKLKSQ